MNMNALLRVSTHLFESDGIVPNSRLPVVVYRQAVRAIGAPIMVVKDALRPIAAAHSWHLDWVEEDAVYSYLHYHSTAHELLLVLEGRAILRIGGTQGLDFELVAGDAIAIPAGVAHQRVRVGTTFIVAGFYPIGQTWDLLRGLPEEYAAAKRNIGNLALPIADPLYGPQGPLTKEWR